MLSVALLGFVPTPAVGYNSRPNRGHSLPCAMVSAEPADAALWTAGLAAAAYFSGYASEGYEPHRL